MSWVVVDQVAKGGFALGLRIHPQLQFSEVIKSVSRTVVSDILGIFLGPVDEWGKRGRLFLCVNRIQCFEPFGQHDAPGLISDRLYHYGFGLVEFLLLNRNAGKAELGYREKPSSETFAGGDHLIERS